MFIGYNIHLFGIAGLVMGEQITPLPSPLPLTFLPFSGHQAYRSTG